VVSKECDFWMDSSSRLNISAERKAHPPLGARADVSHGVQVVDTESHGNRTAPSD